MYLSHECDLTYTYLTYLTYIHHMSRGGKILRYIKEGNSRKEVLILILIENHLPEQVRFKVVPSDPFAKIFVPLNLTFDPILIST